MEAKDVDSALGGLIRLHRKTAGLSQAAFGELCGLSHQQIQKYETGKDRISVSRLVIMARCLSLSSANLMAELEIALQEDARTALTEQLTDRSDPLGLASTETGARIIASASAIADQNTLRALANLMDAIAEAAA